MAPRKPRTKNKAPSIAGRTPNKVGSTKKARRKAARRAPAAWKAVPSVLSNSDRNSDRNSEPNSDHNSEPVIDDPPITGAAPPSLMQFMQNMSNELQATINSRLDAQDARIAELAANAANLNSRNDTASRAPATPAPPRLVFQHVDPANECADISPGELGEDLLGAEVDQAVRTKVQSGAYINLSALSPKNQSHTASHWEMIEGKLVSVANPKLKQPPTYTHWLELWATYTAIRLETEPQLGPELATYQSNILMLKNSSPNSYVWRDYDVRFRRLIARPRSKLQWCVVSWGLVWRLTGTTFAADTSDKTSDQPLRLPFRRKPQFRGNTFRSNRPCFNFNSEGKRCPYEFCKYQHRCSTCKGSHPAFRCAKDERGNQESTGRYRSFGQHNKQNKFSNNSS